MRILTGALYISAGLFTSTLGEEHIHANAHNRRGLSELLGELATAEPLGNAALESQLQGIKTASDVPVGEKATLTLGGEAKTASLPSNQGAIWITLSQSGEAGQSTTTAASTTAAGEQSQAQPSQEPTTTRQSTPTEAAPGNGTVPGAPAAARPAESSVSTTTLTETKTMTVVMPLPSGGVLPPEAMRPGVLPPGVLPPGVLPSTVPPPGVMPPGVLPPGVLPSGMIPGILQPSPAPAAPAAPAAPVLGGMTQGTGTIVNGACNCACNCPANSFPVAPAAPALPVPVVSTTLQTIITPPTAPVVLPSTLVIDTSAPPIPGVSSAPVASAVAPISSAPVVSAPATALPAVTSVSSAIPTVQPLPVVAPALPSVPIAPSALPPSSVPSAPASTLQLGLSTGPPSLPTAIAELAPAQPTINISTFSLVSSLILGPLAI